MKDHKEIEIQRENEGLKVEREEIEKLPVKPYFQKRRKNTSNKIII